MLTFKHLLGVSVSETASQLVLFPRFPLFECTTGSSHHPGALGRIGIFSLTCLPEEHALIGGDLPGSGIVEAVSAVVAAAGDGAQRVLAAELSFTCGMIPA